jgi:hypothetical protein
MTTSGSTTNFAWFEGGVAFAAGIDPTTAQTTTTSWPPFPFSDRDLESGSDDRFALSHM